MSDELLEIEFEPEVVEEECDTDSDREGPASKRTKFAGAYKYKTKYSKEWKKKWPFIDSVRGDPYSFRCSVCSKNLSCGHQGSTDVQQQSVILCWLNQHNHNHQFLSNHLIHFQIR